MGLLCTVTHPIFFWCPIKAPLFSPPDAQSREDGYWKCITAKQPDANFSLNTDIKCVRVWNVILSVDAGQAALHSCKHFSGMCSPKTRLILFRVKSRKYCSKRGKKQHPENYSGVFVPRHHLFSTSFQPEQQGIPLFLSMSVQRKEREGLRGREHRLSDALTDNKTNMENAQIYYVKLNFEASSYPCPSLASLFSWKLGESPINSAHDFAWPLPTFIDAGYAARRDLNILQSKLPSCFCTPGLSFPERPITCFLT